MSILVNPCLLFLGPWIHFPPLLWIRVRPQRDTALVLGGITGEMLALHTNPSRVGPAWCLDPALVFAA
ncbi:hypothetical protein VN97_g612 [Penicillium thymicola]|uniref:Uncharacterized protein n=1 Tax=Penicillium thymicola TaxID=293382 RepID=A0AAI9TSL4_PENTH|nr:hypothetical protein VN97_g612 [Penicillium thymicola]